MKKIQGMTLIGMLFVAAVVISFVLLTMKVVPVYLDNYQVKQAVNSLSDIPPDKLSHSMAANGMQLRRVLINQLYINQVDSVKPKDIIIKPKNYKEFKITLDYKVKQHIISNISLLVDFHIEKEVTLNVP